MIRKLGKFIGHMALKSKIKKENVNYLVGETFAIYIWGKKCVS